jgi:hypothetical protein
MQNRAGNLRERLQAQTQAPQPLSAAELNRRAHEVIAAIDADTGSRTAHAQRVAQLYAVARMIQRAAEAKCGEVTAYGILKFLGTVFARSFLPTLAPR